MNQYPLCRAFDPLIQNGPKITEKAEPTGKFDKLLILRGGGSYYNMVGAIPFFKDNISQVSIVHVPSVT